MFLSIWKTLRGYVMIEATGFSVERFLNMATHNGIYIWDVERGFIENRAFGKNANKIKEKHKYNRKGERILKQEEEKPEEKISSTDVRMKVSIKGYREMRHLAKKTKCKLRIRKKYGIPFVMHKYRKRKFLITGVLFFVFAIYFLSSFIWVVEIKGTERLNAEDVAAYLYECGLEPGSFKLSINKRDIEKELLKKFTDISWINIDINGTKADVLLTEIKPKLEIIDKSTPCDIAAAKDGLIVSIATSAGTPNVKAGDVVKAGDILVSGELLIGTEDTGYISEYVHASAEIIAKMYYEFTFAVPLFYEEKIFTGEIKKEYYAAFMDKKVQLTRTPLPFKTYDTHTNMNQLEITKNYPLPFLFVTTEYHEFTLEQRVRTFSEAEIIGNAAVSNMIIHEFGIETNIMDKEIQCEQQGDFVIVRAAVSTAERIGIEQIMTHDKDITEIETPTEN